MAEDYFGLYCNIFGIADPFREAQERFHKKVTKHSTPSGGEYWIVDTMETKEDEEWEKEWEVRRDEYLRLEHVFRLWEFHDKLSWDKFQAEIEYGKRFTDDWKRYLPCDCAERQCAMTCQYFSGECPRRNGEELIPPNEVLIAMEMTRGFGCGRPQCGMNW